VGRVDDGNAVRDALATIDIESLYGRIKFTPEGDGDPVLMGSAVQQVQGGQTKVVFPVALREAPMQWPIQPFSER
jgi:branched-chain amino acid transport system substrate-binding protein